MRCGVAGVGVGESVGVGCGVVWHDAVIWAEAVCGTLGRARIGGCEALLFSFHRRGLGLEGEGPVEMECGALAPECPVAVAFKKAGRAAVEAATDPDGSMAGREDINIPAIPTAGWWFNGHNVANPPAMPL